jgi:hypothetical protein
MNASDKGNPLQRRLWAHGQTCATLHGNDGLHADDEQGCVLQAGHRGPHEFADRNGKRWLWEIDWECDCEDCAAGDGDFCTVFWAKPAET